MERKTDKANAFADDTTVATLATLQSLTQLKIVLSDFATFSGLTVGAESLCRCRRKVRYLKRIFHGSQNTFKGSQDKFVQFLYRPFSW
jgi:hypothetical protein